MTPINVFEIPTEKPDESGRTLGDQPGHVMLRRNGWHNTDGTPPLSHDDTTGNNVFAYADRNADNLPDPDSSPDGAGGNNLAFDFPLDLTGPPEDYQEAAVTNLFYWNNVIHDVLVRLRLRREVRQLPVQQLRTNSRQGRRPRPGRGPGRQRPEQRELRHSAGRLRAADADVRVARLRAQPARGRGRRHLLRAHGRLRRQPGNHRPDLG